MTLETLVTELKAAFGGALRTVLVYGPAAAGEAVRRADLHVLVVVDDLSLARLEDAGAQLVAWSEAGYPPPLVLTMAEWRSSGDVFPMEYAELLEQHRVLHGALPLEGIAVDPEELRLAVEREAMGTLLQLRRGVLATGTDAARRAELLGASFGRVLGLFRGALRAHGLRPGADPGEVVAEAAFRARLDAALFDRVLAHWRGDASIPGAEVEPVLEGYLEGIARLVAHLDQLSPAARAGAPRAAGAVR
jgi:predicted nucleotidyltransferase